MSTLTQRLAAATVEPAHGLENDSPGCEAYGTSATGTTSAERGVRATHEGSLAHRERRTRRPQRQQPVFTTHEALLAQLDHDRQAQSGRVPAEHRARRAPISPERLLAAQLFVEQQCLLPAWQGATDLVSTCLSACSVGPQDEFGEQLAVSVQRAASGECRWNKDPYLRCGRIGCGLCNPISPSDKLFQSMWKNATHIVTVKTHLGDGRTRIASFVFVGEAPGSWRAIRSSKQDVRMCRCTNADTGEALAPEEGVEYT